MIRGASRDPGRNMKRRVGTKRFVLCVSNRGYQASLIAHKVYERIPDCEASDKGLVRDVALATVVEENPRAQFGHAPSVGRRAVRGRSLAKLQFPSRARRAPTRCRRSTIRRRRSSTRGRGTRGDRSREE